MPYSVIQAQTATALVDELNGVLRAPNALQIYEPRDHSEETFINLNGLTLEFTTPVVTVTFATVDPISLTDAVDEINTQVQSADANFEAKVEYAKIYPGSVRPQKRLTFQTSTAAGLVVDLDSATSTAAEKLGFVRDTGLTLSKAPVDSTSIVSAGDTISGSHYVIIFS